MDFAGLQANLERVRERIASAKIAAGIECETRIVAVTKGHPAAAVRAALRVGLVDVGENRVQEARQKQDELGGEPVRWHLIGHLQSNKAKFVPGRFCLVHSVDSLKLARAVAEQVERRTPGAVQPVLLQVNVAGEAQKGGCAPDEAEELVHEIGALARLELRGLMTMAPLTDDVSVQRATFSSLRQLKEKLEHGGAQLAELSMGMSNDFEAAVAEGATMLRLGTVLFGERRR